MRYQENLAAKMTMDHEDTALFSKMDSVLETLLAKVDETVSQQLRHAEASRRLDELGERLAAELRLNEELSARGAAAARRGGELARAAAALGARLGVAPGDRARLAAARDMYQIAKELTGIRWDFNAPPDVAKGFVKNESRKVLEAFSVAAPAAAALWPRLAAPPAPPAPGKENVPY